MQKGQRKQKKEIQIRNWYLIDAKEQYLGRLASRIISFLRGKHKVNFTPRLDQGDFVVIINASKIKVSGKKAKQKIYWRFSGYPGGLRGTTYTDLFKKNPALVIKFAVWGMLPKNKLRNNMMKRLKIFSGEKHPFGEAKKIEL